MSSSPAHAPRLRDLAALLVVGVLAASACGGDDDASPTATNATGAATTTELAATTPSTSGSATSAAVVDVNDADIQFAQGMIPHHEQAIEMAEIAQDPARQAGPAVIELAARVQAEQDPEIRTMTAWLTAWGQPVEMDTSDGHDMSSMPGMMTVEDMDALTTKNVAEFDDLWLAMMIEHHRGAIEMAIEVHADGANADVKTLAAQIITAQQAEIDEMTALLEG